MGSEMMPNPFFLPDHANAVMGYVAGGAYY